MSPMSPQSTVQSPQLGTQRVFFLVNGIMNFPGCSDNWNGKGVTNIMCPPQSADKAEKIEYFCSIIGRAFGQKGRANKLFKTMLFYRDASYERIAVGHSNGADVILTMMRDYRDWPDIHHLHLVCGAANANFEKNGLNHWLAEGRVKRVTVYVAGKDLALRLAHTWLGRLLHYGVLGLEGPTNVHNEFLTNGRVSTVWEDPWTEYGHSGCWEGRHFERTMALFTGEHRTPNPEHPTSKVQASARR